MDNKTEVPKLLEELSDGQLCRLAILAMYGKVFPKPPDREKLALYAMLLEPMTPQQLSASMQKIVATQSLWPSIAEISAAAESLRQTQENSRTPTYEEAWSEVMHEMSTSFVDRAPRFSTPTIHRVVRDMGWRALCELSPSDLLKARAQFRDLYNQAVERERDERQNKAILDSAEKTAVLMMRSGLGIAHDEPSEIEGQSR